jgi:cytochrome c
MKILRTSQKVLLAGVGSAAVMAGLSFVHPFGNPRNAGGAPGRVLQGAQIPGAVRELIEHKCGDCHSETVAWPVYSRVAPVSWLLERDVLEARAHMNLSRWDSLASQEKIDLLSRMATEARSGEMPPARYTAIHRDAILTPPERADLYGWATGERKRLRMLGRSSGQR